MAQLTQPITGDVENVLYDLYPELLDPTLAPMPSRDGTTSLGHRLKDELYGGERFEGAGLLGGPPQSTIPAEVDPDFGTPFPLKPDYGVPAILPPGPQPGPQPLPPVDLSNLPLIPPLVPGPAAGSYPGIDKPFPSTDTGRVPPIPYPGVGGPPLISPSTGAGVADRIRQASRPAPGDVAPGDVGMVPRPTVKDIQPYRPAFDVSQGVEADQPRFVSRRSDDDFGGLNISDDKKAEIETVANDAKTFLQGVGYHDTGQHGFAQSLMLMYGGGLEPTVTQGPAVNLNVRGEPVVSDRYLNFATGSPSVPSLLPEGQRLGQVTPFGTVSTKVAGQERPVDLTGVTGAGIQEGGEGTIPFRRHLEGLSGVDIDSIPEGFNLNAAIVRSQDNVNQLGSISEKDFEGVDSFEKFGNLIERKLGLQGVSDGVADFIQGLTGMEEADLKGPGLWNTLNTPIPAFKTGEFGITPLDIILVAAGGLPALGPVIMNKFMDSLMKPVKSAIKGGLSSIFEGVFKRDSKEVSIEVSQADINRADIDVLAEGLGIQRHFGMVDAGTYYDASGNVHATNMQPLGIGSNDAGSSGVFRTAAHEMAAKHDPNYKGVYYNINNGDVTVEGQDGTKTVVGTMPIASNGDVLKGDVVEKGGRKDSKTAAHQVKIIYVDPSGKPLESRSNWYYKSSKKDTGAVGGGKQVVKTIWDWLADLAGGSEPE